MTPLRILPLIVLTAVCTGTTAYASDADEAIITATRTPLPTEAELAAQNQSPVPKPVITASSPGLEVMNRMQSLPPVERRVRSEVSVSVGTGGYRSGYVATELPIGDTGTLGIAIGQTDFGKNGGYGYDYGYGRGYGYGRDYGYDYGEYAGEYGYGYGHGGYGQYPGRYLRPTGKSTSVAISLDLNGGKNAKAAKGCTDGVRDRYQEPLWVVQMRGPGQCEDVRREDVRP